MTVVLTHLFKLLSFFINYKNKNQKKPTETIKHKIIQQNSLKSPQSQSNNQRVGKWKTKFKLEQTIKLNTKKLKLQHK